MTFSERMGQKPVKTAAQFNSMDKDLRISLWNVSIEHLRHTYDKIYASRSRFPGSSPSSNSVKSVAGDIWHKYFKAPIDELPKTWEPVEKILKEYFFTCQWYEVYDFIEFVVTDYYYPRDGTPERLMKSYNEVLRREVAGYRFVGNRVAPITSEHEIAAIEDTFAATAASAPLEGVNVNLTQALALLSNRTEPDYRNSIKESISAVEGICKRIANRPDATLGQVLPAIQRPGHAIMPPHLQAGIRSLWGYTNGPEGIRHAMMEMTTIDVEDARFMLVTCAGLISYLIEKARKAGIAL